MVKLGYRHGRELNTVLVRYAWIPMQIRKSCLFRCCGSSSGLDLDSLGSLDLDQDPDPGGKNDPKKLNFLESLDVHGGGRLLL
jgi:hypothetical protein